MTILLLRLKIIALVLRKEFGPLIEGLLFPYLLGRSFYWHLDSAFSWSGVGLHQPRQWLALLLSRNPKPKTEFSRNLQIVITQMAKVLEGYKWHR